jgi:hypothetical protein
LRNRNVRLAALEHPEWFRVELLPEALDVEWLREQERLSSSC